MEYRSDIEYKSSGKMFDKYLAQKLEIGLIIM